MSVDPSADALAEAERVWRGHRSVIDIAIEHDHPTLHEMVLRAEVTAPDHSQAARTHQSGKAEAVDSR
jgi:hypothetical protein